MKKYFLLLLFCVGCQLIGAQTLKDIIKNIPEDNIFGLSNASLQYLVENSKDSIVKTSNYLSDNITRDLISQDYFRVRTSKVGTTELKLLPLINQTNIICVVKTICSTVCDSQIYFFTDKWIPIDKKTIFPMIQPQWFLENGGMIDGGDKSYALTILKNTFPVKYQLNPTTTDLELTIDPSKFLDINTYKEFKDVFILDPISLTWNNSQFTKN